jgi:Sulfotransferase family
MFSQTYPKPLKRFMLDDDRLYGRFLLSIRSVRPVSALLAGMNFVVRDRANWLWYANLNHLVLRSYFFHAAEARGCRRVVEKTPTNTRNIDKLSRTFPGAQLLYVHRHPIDVFSSYRRRAEVDTSAAWAELTLPEFCDMYEQSTRRVLRWVGAGHTNLLMVRYEHFTTEPQAEFRRTCEFLGEPFEPDAVEERNPQPNRWWGDPHLWGEIVPSTKRWWDYMSEFEANSIQDRLASTMRALGYEPRRND